MNKRTVINRFFWVFGAVLLLLSASYGSKKVKSAEISDVKIEIKETEKGSFVNKIEVNDRLNNFYAPSLIDQEKSDLKVSEVDSLLTSSPFIKFSKTYTNVKGELFIEIEQEVPLFRVINKKGSSYYVSTDGRKFPLSAHKAAKVIVATGNIIEEVYPTDSLSTKVLKDLHQIASYLEENDFFKALSGQLYVAENGDIKLITKSEERHDIILGDAQNLESKFDNLYQFYTKVLTVKGWNSYKTINLKFRNQIVAKK
ncbi:MAG: hypothetical protein JXQ87_12180 [Bacteroidia bacterium]